MIRSPFVVLLSLCFFLVPLRAQQSPSGLTSSEAEYEGRDFHFKSGDSLPQLRLHYTTLGKLERDSTGKATNAVLIRHSTGGVGSETPRPRIRTRLYVPCPMLPPTHTLS